MKFQFESLQAFITMGGHGIYVWPCYIFVFAVLIIALNLGRSRTLLALLSIYAASFLENHFLYFDKLRELFSTAGGSALGGKNLPDYWLHLGLFLLIYIIVFAILNRSFLKHYF